MRSKLKTGAMIAVFAIAGMIGLIVSACSSRTPSPVEGKWKGSSQTETVEFQKDGSIQAVDQAGNLLTGQFELIDKDHVKLVMTSSSVDKTGVIARDTMSTLCKFEVQGATLTLIEEDGLSQQYSRAR